MTRILCSGVGTIELDLENRTLRPVDLKAAYRLWWMVMSAPRKATRRMDECERVADDYAGDSLGWYWDLPVPSNYQPCPCCVC